MQPTPAVILLSLMVIAVVSASVWCWIVALARIALTFGWLPAPISASIENALKSQGTTPRLPLIPWSRWRPVPWTFFDLLAFLALWFMAVSAVSAVLKNSGGLPDFSDVEKLTLAQREVLTAANIVISVLIAAIGLPIVALRTGARPRDFGWSPADFLSDLRLGLIGFVMLAPPTYALQALLVYFWKPSNHPLLEMFKSTPDARFFAILVVAAAIVAPIFEELMFRVLLQGFLEKAFSFRGEVHELFFGSRRREIIEATEDPPVMAREIAELPVDQPMHFAWQEPPSLHVQRANADPARINPYISPAATDRANPPYGDSPSVADPAELRGLAAWLPIAISSLVFALMHYSHGPDWVPLTFLAAGMGYLYQRTHRLVPSLVVHVSLNGLSMWGLWVYVGGLGARG